MSVILAVCNKKVWYEHLSEWLNAYFVKVNCYVFSKILDFLYIGIKEVQMVFEFRGSMDACDSGTLILPFLKSFAET